MNAQVVSFNCVLKTMAGQLISSSVNRDVLTCIPTEGVLLKGLAEELQQLKKGERRQITLRAEQAYGFYDPKKVILFPLVKIPDSKNVRCGQIVSIRTKSGQVRTYSVTKIYGDMVSLDGNHPLAGQDLIFEIETTDAREATREEVEEAQNPISNQVLH